MRYAIATIRLLRLGSNGGARPLRPYHPRTAQEVAVVSSLIRFVKRLRLLSTKVILGEGVRLTPSIAATIVASPGVVSSMLPRAGLMGHGGVVARV